MTEFNAKPLGILDRLYRFVGGLTGVNKVALRSPIQLVHDVSREAEIARGFYFMQSAEITVVSAPATIGRSSLNLDTEIFGNVGPETRLAELGIPKIEAAAWLLGISGEVPSADIGAFVACTAGVQKGGPNHVRDESYIVFHANGALQTDPLESGGTIQLAFVDAASVSHPTTHMNQLGFPIFMPQGEPNTLIRFLVEGDGVADTRVNWSTLWWIGPADSYPPPSQ